MRKKHRKLSNYAVLYTFYIGLHRDKIETESIKIKRI